MPQFSIITICRNAAGEIERTIQSVLAQTARDEMEYIVIDGGSTDGTQDVIEKYRSQIDHFVSEPDAGIADAFNKGVRAARGRWINFMNAGDRFASPQAVSAIGQKAGAGCQTSDVIYGKCALENSAGQIVATIGRPFSARAFRSKMTLPHQAIFHNTDFFAKHGLYDSSFKIAMDYELLLRAGASLRACFVDELISIQRTGGASQANPPRTYVEYKAAQQKHGVPMLEAQAYYDWHMLKHLVKLRIKN
ncbi:MAG: glycosyltransferase family 2 protein [Anaerolineae bacterium]|nr:glycosyltransferase family 2 protein [Thermoflexales bacterium]